MPTKNGRGFAGMDPQRQREIASLGGKAAHKSGNAHEWSSAEARKAGRLGGIAAHQKANTPDKGGTHPDAASQPPQAEASSTTAEDQERTKEDQKRSVTGSEEGHKTSGYSDDEAYRARSAQERSSMSEQDYR